MEQQKTLTRHIRTHHILWNNGRFRLVVIYRPKPRYLFEANKLTDGRMQWITLIAASKVANGFEPIRQFIEHMDAEKRAEVRI